MSTLFFSPDVAGLNDPNGIEQFSDDLVAEGFTAPGDAEVVSGFRMEGAPEFEVVFGDTQQYRSYVDRYYAVHEDMKAVRSTFARHVQGALTYLDVNKKKGKVCESSQLAALYYQAKRAGDTFRRHGAEFEGLYVAITELDDLGETAGLTPDYRWRIESASKMYRQALTDYKEMRISFLDQLGTEVESRGCTSASLLAAGKTAPVPTDKELADIASSRQLPKYRLRWNETEKPVVQASTAAFIVDNRKCDRPVSVYVDGTLLGEVEQKSKGAFQALNGRHAMCLITPADTAEGKSCGDPGTVRTSYIHDGWAITLHCGD